MSSPPSAGANPDQRAPGDPRISSPPLPPLTFGERILSGGVAGLSELLVMYPLDVVKTRAQLYTGAARAQPSTVRQLISLVQKEKLGTYRGISSPALMETPKRAIKFAVNESLKPVFADRRTGQVGQAGATAAGMGAGIVEAVVVVPFELVKIRLQDAASKARYGGPADVIREVVRKDGVLGLWTGLESTLWRHILWNGGYFGLIHTIRKRLPAPTSEKQHLRNNFVAGALAGSFGTLLNTPTDVVKSRVQNQVIVPGQAPKYTWTIQALATIVREEGFTALYKGFTPKVMRLGPGGGILLMVFDFVSKKLQQRRA